MLWIGMLCVRGNATGISVIFRLKPQALPVMQAWEGQSEEKNKSDACKSESTRRRGEGDHLSRSRSESMSTSAAYSSAQASSVLSCSISDAVAEPAAAHGREENRAIVRAMLPSQDTDNTSKYPTSSNMGYTSI
eukprot:6185100-Pleurochrysis_carterae.AAC.1